MLLKGAPGLTAMRLYRYVYTVYVQLFHSELNNMIGWVHWPGLGFPACLGRGERGALGHISHSAIELA